MIQDAAIIGNGPAGLSAALYLLRAGFSVTVIGQDNGALEKAGYIENYFGLGTPKTGHQLVEDGKAQVLRLGGQLLRDQVVGITWDGDFLVDTAGGQLTARTILLTTGTSRKIAPIDQLDRLEGRGVSYCAVCDAFFFREKPVALLGDGEYALHELKELLPITGPVTVCTNGLSPSVEFPPKVTVRREPIRRLVGEERLEAVEFSDGSILPVEALFVALGTAKGSDLARKLGIRLEDNRIVVNEQMATPLPGVFAAGDCTGGIYQISIAVGEGARAALSAIRFLRENQPGESSFSLSG